MLKTKCAKCGKTVMRLNSKTSVSSKSFPIFLITRYNEYDGPPDNLELCKKCSTDFENWLENGLEGY